MSSGRGCVAIHARPLARVELAERSGLSKQTVSEIVRELEHRASAAYVARTAPGDKWIEGIAPTEPATPLHPNARGARGFADALPAA